MSNLFLATSKYTIAVLGVWLAVKVIGISYNHHKDAFFQKPGGSNITAELRDKQVACLTKNIYYEAGFEPFEGKVAVAQVTINRAESGNFPSDICAVIYQKNVFYEKVVCQFSWYCDNPNRSKPVNKEVYKEAEIVAKKVLLEGYRLDSLNSALYYHADYVHPKWNKTKITQIGRHIFYR